MSANVPAEVLREHLTMLKSMGVDTLSLPPEKGQQLRALLESAAPVPFSAPAFVPVTVSQTKVTFNPAPAPAQRSALTANPDMPKTQIDVHAIPATPLPPGDKKTQWEWLKNHVITHPEVLKHVRQGVQPVFGVGNINSPIFFCGEAPGAEEEQQGEPFVGRAGQLLTKIIQAMGVERKDVYIANILNWRPEKDDMTFGNRPPTLEEMAKCLPFLKAQVNIVQPKVIVALGATAVTGLLGHDPDRRMGDTRGKFFEFNKTPVMVTYHPSYLLRNNTNAAKRVVWEDILLVMKKVGMPISAAQEKFFT